jgi:hypothetical protein
MTETVQGGAGLAGALSFRDATERLRRHMDAAERSYRLQVGTLTPAEERALAEPFVSGAEAEAEREFDALCRRYWQVKHFNARLHEGDGAPEGADPGAARRALSELMRRVPVPVTLANGRTVEVTGRSLSALEEIAARWGRIRLLHVDLEVCARQFSDLEIAVRAGDEDALESLCRCEDGHRRLYAELHYQRLRLYADAFTANGGPSAPDATPPEWAHEIQPQDDAALIVALHEAGPGRLSKLGEFPLPPRGDGPIEDWGWDSLLAFYEGKRGMNPANLRDSDLGQFAAWIRANAAVETPASELRYADEDDG